MTWFDLAALHFDPQVDDRLAKKLKPDHNYLGPKQNVTAVRKSCNIHQGELRYCAAEQAAVE
jgi:hypothetical protein